jgi:hypothetical protein
MLQKNQKTFFKKVISQFILSIVAIWNNKKTGGGKLTSKK